MVGPLAVDPQVLARQALLMEADLGQHGLGRLVVRQAGGLETVQPEVVEHERQAGPQCVGHQTLPGKGLAHPVTDRGRLGDTTPDVAEIDAAGQPPSVVGEDEQAISFARSPFARLLAQAAAEMVAAEGILRPGRLPGREKGPTAGPELGPFGPIIHGRSPQKHAPTSDSGHPRQRQRDIGKAEHLGL